MNFQTEGYSYMQKADLTRLESLLVEAESIVQASLEQKTTLQDLDLKKALIKLRLKVLKRSTKLK